MTTASVFTGMDVSQFEPPVQTSMDWVRAVEAEFPIFVADHASNERKAAASAMDFVVRYPDCHALVAFAAKVAQQEIAHFRQVFRRMRLHGYELLPDTPSLLMGHMMAFVRPHREERRMDRILLAALMELRGLERFALLATASELPQIWKNFYRELTVSEKDHWMGYIQHAILLSDVQTVQERWKDWIAHESELTIASDIPKLFA